MFGDDVFSNIPTGNFRVYFRTGAGTTYKISPDEMQNLQLVIPYVSHSNQIENLTIGLSLQSTVANASARENLRDVKLKAQQQYYTQDRMITGEDYQILPYTKFSNIIKSKAINRTASGISRYLDVRDTTGKYSSTNIVAEDGISIAQKIYNSSNLHLLLTVILVILLVSKLKNILKTKVCILFKNYGGISVTGLSASWNLSTTTAVQ